MSQRKAITVNVELAFDVFCAEGGNMQATLRALKKDHGLNLTRDTLRDWKDKYRFEERKTQTDAQRQADAEALRTAKAQILKGLLESKKRYEKYFGDREAESKKPDHMAQFAYNGIISQVRMLIGRIDPEGVIPVTDDPTSEEAMKILEEHYGVKA